MDILKDIPELATAKVRFGLEAQGHLPTIKKMRAANASWEEIARAVGWETETLKRHYEWHLEDHANQTTDRQP